MAYKLQVIIGDELKEKIEMYAKKSGISMSSLCNVFIGQGIMGYDKAFEMADRMMENASKAIESKKEKIEIR